MTGKAGTEAAATEVERAPVVVAEPLYGPWDVVPVTWEDLSGAVKEAADEMVVVAEETNGMASDRVANARRLAPVRSLK